MACGTSSNDCTYNGVTYKDGTAFPDAAGCKCYCKSGKADCATNNCDGSHNCSYNGKTYTEGANYVASDGCNQCFCKAGGTTCSTAKCTGLPGECVFGNMA